jgi:RIO-like serine/threonine protein kinase
MKQSLLQEIHDFTLFGEHAAHFEYLASGKDGDVYTRDNYVIKVFKEGGKSRDDGMKLHLLKRSIYYPKVHSFTNDFMVSDRIFGETFYQLDGHSKNLRKQYETEINQAIIDAQNAGLNAFDLHNHNLMLSNDGEVRIVDVGRFSLEEETLQLGFFKSLFGSSHRRHKKHKRRHEQSSSRHHYRHSSSSRRHHRRHSSSYSSYSS